MNNPTSTAEPYIGDELELFADAIHWKTYFARQIQPFVKGNVLEVGAGLGGTTAVLHPGDGGVVSSWTCLEPDGQLTGQIEESVRNGELPSSCRVIQGILSDLPDDEKFDAILYIDVLEHIEDDHGEMERAADRLKSGGCIIVLVPAYQWLYSPFDKAIGHYRRYSRRTLRAVTPEAAPLERLRCLDSVGVAASAANRFLMKQGMPKKSQLRFWDNVLVPMSKIADPLTGFLFGKSVLGVWRRP